MKKCDGLKSNHEVHVHCRYHLGHDGKCRSRDGDEFEDPNRTVSFLWPSSISLSIVSWRLSGHSWEAVSSELQAQDFSAADILKIRKTWDAYPQPSQPKAVVPSGLYGREGFTDGTFSHMRSHGRYPDYGSSPERMVQLLARWIDSDEPPGLGARKLATELLELVDNIGGKNAAALSFKIAELRKGK